ncbi:hypothetical protein TGVEG_279560 [Toxoplasma gondii VEG]|uniref:Uncharacterized protein n=1 Tax=Toxoplasma gondii (strain ATCC 50861 / VEG) TaxID=432359 RepID=V5AWM7_TOXGV|nr:hypothetical protein TGVEG_279560 [Toxoplasma gondii VEG]
MHHADARSGALYGNVQRRDDLNLSLAAGATWVSRFPHAVVAKCVGEVGEGQQSLSGWIVLRSVHRGQSGCSRCGRAVVETEKRCGAVSGAVPIGCATGEPAGDGTTRHLRSITTSESTVAIA